MVNVTHGGFLFVAAAQVPRLMDNFAAQDVRRYTLCRGIDADALAIALARDYGPLEHCFSRVLSRSSSHAGLSGA